MDHYFLSVLAVGPPRLQIVTQYSFMIHPLIDLITTRLKMT